MIALESLAPCFQGILPAQLCTCSADGMPNVAYVSHVEYVDADHVALSFQFFNKSRRNIAENPQAEVLVVDPDTAQGWRLQLHYVRSETSGPLFDRMALRIEAIATYSGLKGIFRLRAADVYRVLAIEPVPEETGRAGAVHRNLEPAFTFTGVRRLMARVSKVDTLESLMDAILAGMDDAFGCGHTVMLLPTEQDGVLVTVATRGYTTHSVGAEVRYGEGIGGFVAEARAPLRISGLVRGMLYALAMHSRQHESPLVQRTRQIPAAGLENADSQLGIPLIVRDELVGVIVLESRRPYRYHEEDRACVEVIGQYLALAIQHMQWQERMADGVAADSQVEPRETRAPDMPAARRRCVAYHATDQCVLLDGEYLVRGLPARILWRLLKVREATGRDEFTNRELRLDKSLELPAWKDNLESRLILLRRRLCQKCPDIRLVSRGRGRFALETDSAVVLSEFA